MYVPVNRPLLSGNEKKYVLDCLDSNWISSSGKYIELFEKQFADFVGRKYAVSVSNGTVALELALSRFNFKSTDEVIVTNFTIISCLSAIIRSGAKPVIVDVDPVTWNMNIEQVREKINENTKAILAVHIYNYPVELDKLIQICNENNLFLIEDGAEQIGQVYKNKKIGSFGDVSVFSFYANKNITTGEGGMILTDNKSDYEYYRKYKNLAFEKERFVHKGLGYNFRMTNIQAALGLAQLENIDFNLRRKKEIGLKYNNELKSLKDRIYFPTPKMGDINNIYWIFGFTISAEIKLNAKELSELLYKKGIETRPFFCPMSKQPVFKNLFKGNYPVSDYLYEKGLYLPSGIGNTDIEIDYVINALKQILHEF